MQGTAPAATGTSAAILTRQDIAALPGGDAQSLTQIALTQPGFTPDTFGPDGIFHIRGAEAGVLYVIDGIQLPNGLAGQFTDVLPTALVQRMNLVVGGMPVEYGPSTGGVFDITTRRGGDQPAGEAEIVYGTYQKVQPSAWYAQAFDKLNVFAAGSYLSTDRGLDTPDVTPILHDHEKAGTALARLNYDATDHDRVELVTRYSEQHFQIPIDPSVLPLSDLPPGTTRGSDSYGNAPPPFVPYNANPTELERDFFVTAAYTHTFSNGNLLIAPYFRSFYTDLLCDPANTLGPTARPRLDVLEHRPQPLPRGRQRDVRVGCRQVAALEGRRPLRRQPVARRLRPVHARRRRVGGGRSQPGADRVRHRQGGDHLRRCVRPGRDPCRRAHAATRRPRRLPGRGVPGHLAAEPHARVAERPARCDLRAERRARLARLRRLPVAAAERRGRVGRGSPAGSRPRGSGDPDRPQGGDQHEDVELGVRYQRSARFDADLTVYGRLSQNTIDVTNVGETSLVVDYNYNHGRAYGAELSTHVVPTSCLSGFANLSWDVDEAKGIESEQYLFDPSDLVFSGYQILDHVQKYTVNAGIDLHDRDDTHLAVSFQYGSGLRTGPDNNETVPGHSVWNLTLRHRFAFAVHPELAIDVFNVFDSAYAIRIGNGFVGSAYGALREVNLRLTIPFGAPR